MKIERLFEPGIQITAQEFASEIQIGSYFEAAINLPRNEGAPIDKFVCVVIEKKFGFSHASGVPAMTMKLFIPALEKSVELIAYSSGSDWTTGWVQDPSRSVYRLTFVEDFKRQHIRFFVD